MVYPIRTPSNETVKNAVFDYLNFNRHKFDERGNLDAKQDERDYVPAELVGYRVRPPKPLRGDQPSRENKVYRKPQEPPRERGIKVLGKPIPPPKDGKKYTSEECDDLRFNEIVQCKQTWERRSPSYAYGECIRRANDRFTQCALNGNYDPESEPYSAQDLHDEDREKYGYTSQRLQEALGTAPTESSHPSLADWMTRELNQFLMPVAENPDMLNESALGSYDPYAFSPPWGAPAVYRAPLMPRELQRKIPRQTLFHMPPEEMLRPAEASWARGQLGHFSPPLVEGSQQELPTEFQRLLPLMPHLARALQGIRVTRGAGAGGGIGSRFGKRPLTRMPIDALNSNAIIY